MLKRLDTKFLRSLHVLVRQPAWADVEAFLKSELSEIHERLVATADATAIHELRGRAKELTEFLHTSANTQDLLGKLENRP